MMEKIKAEKEKSFLDNWLETEFNEQYESQVEILQRLGLVNLLPDSEKMGIVGIDGKEYPVPSKEDIIREIKSNPEKYETKMKQGFTKIQLTPFALPLEELTITFERCLRDHEKRKKLFWPRGSYEFEMGLRLDSEELLSVASIWINGEAPEGKRGADVTSECIYHVTKCNGTNCFGGQTKVKILEEQHGLPFAGWEVKLLEKNLIIPGKGAGKVINGRKQFEDLYSPMEYIQQLQRYLEYAHEQGLTIEDWLWSFIHNLEETKVLNISGGMNYFLIGSYNSTYNEIGSFGRIIDEDDQASFYIENASLDYGHVASGIITAVPLGPELKFEK
ncbi:MAG: hypothetical protein AAB766_04200 [Patescibacteria group bacterium]